MIWVLVIFLVIIVGAMIWVVVRRRRRAAATPPPAQPSGPSTEELTEQANALLIELDDDLRASERELQLAAAQYGAGGHGAGSARRSTTPGRTWPRRSGCG